jgi:hypothetical protein
MRPASAPSSFAVQVFQPDPRIVYSIEAAAQITHLPRRAIAVYCQRGLVSTVVDPELGMWFFD